MKEENNTNSNVSHNNLRDFIILILILKLYLFLNSDVENFLNIIFSFSLILNIPNIIVMIKYKNIVLFLLRILCYAIFIFYLIKEHNPFYLLIFFWIPFSNIFKAFMIIKVFSLLVHREFRTINDEEIKNKIKKEFLYMDNLYFDNLIAFVLKTKKRIFLLFSLLIIIKIICVIYTEKLFILFKNPKDTIRNQKFFIAANLFNVEDTLQDWQNEMLKLINYLGEENVFVSIFENGDSTDSTPLMLRFFSNELNSLGIKNHINTNNFVSKHDKERIVFLAILRNMALKPLFRIEEWDLSNVKVLFFNDIIFTYTDIIKLIETNDQKYDLACGLDFYESFYDVWVSLCQDLNYLKFYYPYFSNKIAQNRLINGENIRTFSCWNGVVSIKGEVFKDWSLRFRAAPLEIGRQSECMLLIMDMRNRGYDNVILNPNVKVTYTYYYYYMNKYVYPYTKNLFTYFYYYFANILVPPNYSFSTLEGPIEIHEGIIEAYEYYKK